MTTRFRSRMCAFNFLTLLPGLLMAGVVASAQNWPSFRGENGSGVGDGEPPVAWDVATGSNVVWKSALEGLANSSPIIWDNRIFVTTATSSSPNPKFEADPTWGSGIVDGDEPWTWKVICLDKSTGKQLWEKTAHTGLPKRKRHSEATQANCTPVTDGRFVVAMFGSEGMFCYTVEGEFAWKVDFGILRAGPHNMPSLEWGFSSSPIIHDGKVIMQCDVLDDPFIAVLDLKTGKELRRIKRDDIPGWSTPSILLSEGAPQLICNGFRHIGAYDLATGKEVWRLSGRGDIPVPRPVLAEGLIFITSNHAGRAIYAIKPSAQGNLTPGTGDDPSSGLAWWNSRLGSYLPTPVAYQGILYVPDERGMISAFDAKTGQAHYQQERWAPREGARYYSSPVAAGGRIYHASIPGVVHVLRAGKEFEKLASNSMGETCYATPAVSNGRLFIRTRSHLFCIGTKQP